MDRTDRFASVTGHWWKFWLMPSHQMVHTQQNSAPVQVEHPRDKEEAVVETVSQCTLPVANMMNTSGLTTILSTTAVTIWMALN